MAKRIQRKRTKGWKMPANAVYCYAPGPGDTEVLVCQLAALLRAPETEAERAAPARGVAPLLKCPGCDRGLPVLMLDDDGVRTDVSGRPGTPSHAVSDAWWPCPRWQLAGTAPAAPMELDAVVDAYQKAKDNWCAQCFCFRSAPDAMRRSAHEAAREGFDVIYKVLWPIVGPVLKAEFEEASRLAKSTRAALAAPSTTAGAPTPQERDEAELTHIPVSYETPTDHYREMARRFAEDRDVQKHRARELGAQVETLTRELAAARLLNQRYEAYGAKDGIDAEQALTALREKLEQLPRYKVSELDGMLLPEPQPAGEWIRAEDLLAVLALLPVSPREPEPGA